MWIQFYNLICYNFLDINLYLTGYQLLSNSLYIEQLSHFCTSNVGQMENIFKYFFRGMNEWHILWAIHIWSVFLLLSLMNTHTKWKTLTGHNILEFSHFFSKFCNSSIFFLKYNIVEMILKCLILGNPCITYHLSKLYSLSEYKKDIFPPFPLNKNFFLVCLQDWDSLILS